MTKVNDYLIHAELAQTAYGTLSEGVIVPILLTGENVEMYSSQDAEYTKI